MARTPAFERYARDSALVLGGAAAILLQLGDPVVARGVARHSAFRDDPMMRLRHTLGFVYAVMLGDAEQLRRVAERVDAAHADVSGALDPERQLWVAATLYRVGVDVYELLRGPMPDDVADEVYSASALLGTALQMPADRWPPGRA